MKDLREFIPGVFNKKNKRLSGILVKSATALIVTGMLAGLFLGDFGLGVVGGYLMNICFALALVLLFVNVITIFRVEQ